MKKYLHASAAALAMTMATPALAQDAVETVEIEMSEERRALALAAVDAYWPEGQGQHMVNYMTGDFADFVLYTPISEMADEFGLRDVMGAFAVNMAELQAAMAEMEGEDADASEEEGADEDKVPTEAEMQAMADMMIAMFGDKTVADMIGEEDPHFEERVTIIRDVLQSELTPMFGEMEPVMRATYAEMFAKRFSDAELADIAAFSQTAGGQKYAREQWLFAFDPSYYKAMFMAAPEAMTAMPDMIKTLEERMAHLPPMGGEEDEEEAAEEAAPTAEELIAEAEELEAEAAELTELAAELRAQAAELE